MVRVRSSNPFIDPYKTKEHYKNYVTVDSSNRGDYPNIQLAIDSIVDAAEDNKYIIHVFGSDYNANIILNKPFISLAFEPSVRLISNLGDTLIISNNNEKHYCLSVKSDSANSSDNAFKIQGTGNPKIIDSEINSSSVATGLKVNDNSNPILQDVNVDSNGDALVILGNNNVRFLSGDLNSGFGKKDIYLITTSQLELGNVNYSRNKCDFLGTKTLTKKSEDVAVDNDVLNFASEPKTVEEALIDISSGKITNVILGENVSKYDVLYMDSGKAYIASRDDVNKIDIIGMARSDGNLNDTISIFQDDIVINPSWNFNTTRKYVYLSLNGQISDVAPISSGNTVVELGGIIENNKIRFYLGGNKVTL